MKATHTLWETSKLLSYLFNAKPVFYQLASFLCLLKQWSILVYLPGSHSAGISPSWTGTHSCPCLSGWTGSLSPHPSCPALAHTCSTLPLSGFVTPSGKIIFISKQGTFYHVYKSVHKYWYNPQYEGIISWGHSIFPMASYFRISKGVVKGIQTLTHFDIYIRADVLKIKGDWNPALNSSLPGIRFPSSVTGSAYWLGTRSKISRSPFLNWELNPFDKGVLVSWPPENVFTFWKPWGVTNNILQNVLTLWRMFFNILNVHNFLGKKL